ncbi:Mbeg1-like protein [Tumebacillus permanentifrigoris]|uniref:DUF2974 family protein n=1 Tax=Tumebacillus permanentifrigoris TaxID=378543 RepID=A0A316D528_9BACL|nr:Mbeg1-like protein [Tumebacillus permanentifrigoris]PWK07923.1 hypothetical protein C7459_11682 [Tumebacillus permanentifrigoris]
MATFQEYVQLSNFVYTDNLHTIPAGQTIADMQPALSNWRSGVDLEVVGNWRMVYLMDRPASGFFGAAFRKSDEVIVAYRGTEPDNIGDWVADAAFASRLMERLNPQMDDAIDLFRAVQAEYPDHTLTITGHSLGGGLAQKAAMSFNTVATTFNGPGALHAANHEEHMKFLRGDYDHVISNYVQSGDIFVGNNRLLRHAGQVIVLNEDQLGMSVEDVKKILHFAFHPIVNFNGDCNPDGSLNEAHVVKVRLEDKPSIIRDTAESLLAHFG